MAAFLLPLLGAAASVAGAAINARARKRANERNVAFTRETNRENREFQREINASNIRERDPATIRKKFEAAGFDPLLGIGGATPATLGASVSQAPYVEPIKFGDGIARAALAFQDGYNAQTQLQLQKQQLQMQNAEMQTRLEAHVLKPTTPDLYGGARASQNSFGAHGSSYDNGGGGVTTDPSLNQENLPSRDTYITQSGEIVQAAPQTFPELDQSLNWMLHQWTGAAKRVAKNVASGDAARADAARIQGLWKKAQAAAPSFTLAIPPNTAFAPQGPRGWMRP